MRATRRALRNIRLSASLVHLSKKTPAKTIAVWSFYILACICTFPWLSIEASTESVLDKGHQRWSKYQESLRTFGGDEVIVIAVQSRHPFSDELLDIADRLSAALEAEDGVRRVDSITTYPIIRTDSAGALHLTAATEASPAAGQPSPASIQQILLLDRVAPQVLFSRDTTTIAINVLLDEEPSRHYGSILNAISESTSTIPQPQYQVYVSGVPVFQRSTSQSTRSELIAFAPLTACAMALLVTLAFRSSIATLAILGNGTAGICSTLAAATLTGTPISFPMVIVPPITVAMATAYGMHMLAAGTRESSSQRPDTQCPLEKAAPPIALSGLTTAIGFISASFIEIDAVRDVALFGAIGVISVLCSTLSLLPAILTLLRLPAARHRARHLLSASAPKRLSAIATSHPRALFSTWAIAVIFSILGVMRIDIDTDATRWFRDGTEVRDDYEAIRAKLSGISPINIVIQANTSDADSTSPILSPRVLDSLHGLTEFLSSMSEVGKAVSAADPIFQLHHALGNDPSTYPTSSPMINQYLLLLDGVDPIADLISTDRLSTNILIRLRENGSAKILEVGRTAEDWWKEHGPSNTIAYTTGIMWEFARAQDKIARGQLFGLLFAMVAVGALLLAAFRSPRVAIACMIPNVLPVFFIYGSMGALGIPLDAGTVLIGTLAIGIAVDDTVHLTHAYLNAPAERRTSEAALEWALSHSLLPITLTSAAVGAGFLVLGASDFTFVRNLGLLMSAVMATCLVADTLLLPALLSAARPRMMEGSCEGVGRLKRP